MRLAEEDPTIRFVNNVETKEMVISGMGEQHLDMIVSKLKSKFGVDVTLRSPRVPYRETIRKTVSVQGPPQETDRRPRPVRRRLDRVRPCDADGLEFAERVVGGAVPKGFFPAVEKGPARLYREGGRSRATRSLASRPRCTTAPTTRLIRAKCRSRWRRRSPTRPACRRRTRFCSSPSAHFKVTVPDANMGDIMGEVNKRRGRVLGMSPADAGYQTVEAEAPMAEMHDFSTYVRQVTQGRGKFTFEFIRYEGGARQRGAEGHRGRKGRGRGRLTAGLAPACIQTNQRERFPRSRFCPCPIRAGNSGPAVHPRPPVKNGIIFICGLYFPAPN